MALSELHGVRMSQTSPAFLHANSTSHTWIFSAIAELVDNAYDPDVNAANLWIDKRMIGEQTCLVLMDDGSGCAPDNLHKMLSFGYCGKFDIKGHKPIGHYGNGFKSGTMRLGRDAMVFTKHGRSLSLGFLSQTFLESINSDTVLVPIVTWERRSLELVEAPDTKGSLEAILKYSLFHTEDDLTKEFNAIQSGTGTRIIIYNLKRGSDNHLELDFESDKLDIVNPEHHELDFVGGLMSRAMKDHQPEYRRSLREYLSMLFLKPKMKITLRGRRVKTQLIRKSLRKTRKTTYTPSWMMSSGKKGVEIYFGFGPSKHDYGIMMYHRNRLIKAYEHVGIQKQANEMGVGVVGVVEVDFLEAIHNKQDFSKTDRYNACISALGLKLNQYWHAVTGNAESASEYLQKPDWTWVQCEQCLKWRRLPDAASDNTIPEKWYCFMNPDRSHNRCDIDEEPENEDDVFRLVVSKSNRGKGNNVPLPPVHQNSFNPNLSTGRGAVVLAGPYGSGRGQRGLSIVPLRGQRPGMGQFRMRMPQAGPSRPNIRFQVKSEFGPPIKIKTEGGQKSPRGGRKRKDLNRFVGSASDSDGDDETSHTKKTRKSTTYTETRNNDGSLLLVLDSDDEDSSVGRYGRSPEDVKPIINGQGDIKPPPGADHNGRSSSPSAAEMELKRQLMVSESKLEALRRNVQLLLRTLVPDVPLVNPEKVDSLVIELISVNARSNSDAGTSDMDGTGEASSTQDSLNLRDTSPTPVKLPLTIQGSALDSAALVTDLPTQGNSQVLFQSIQPTQVVPEDQPDIKVKHLLTFPVDTTPIIIGDDGKDDDDDEEEGGPTTTAAERDSPDAVVVTDLTSPGTPPTTTMNYLTTTGSVVYTKNSNSGYNSVDLTEPSSSLFPTDSLDLTQDDDDPPEAANSSCPEASSTDAKPLMNLSESTGIIVNGHVTTSWTANTDSTQTGRPDSTNRPAFNQEDVIDLDDDDEEDEEEHNDDDNSSSPSSSMVRSRDSGPLVIDTVDEGASSQQDEDDDEKKTETE